MRFLPLIWRNLWRRKLRTLLTILSIMIAFLLYGFLSAVRAGMTAGVTVAGQDRLVVRHKVSIIQTLPVSYLERIRQIPGVKEVSHSTWFGGIYQEAKNFFPQIPVEPVSHLAIYPEFKLPEDQVKAWMQTRTGAIVGRKTANKYGFKIGDRVPIQPTIWRRSGPNPVWEFDVVGIYDAGNKATDTTQLFFRYDYFEEARVRGKGEVGWYVVRVSDPNRSEEIAKKIDETFLNSPWETKAESEKAFVQSFAKQVGDIGAIVTAVLSAVFFTILLIAGNTMAQSIRERIGEIGLLKALGFGNGLTMGLVLAESLLIVTVGAGLGLGFSWMLISVWDPTGGALPVFYFPTSDLGIGLGIAWLLGIIIGIVPSIQALRLRVAESLRRL